MRPTPRRFTKEEINSLHEVFDELDRDNNHILDKAEFKTFIEEAGLDPTFLDATFLVFSKDPSKNYLTFDDFLEYLHASLLTSQDPDYLNHLIFNAIDKDGNGSLDAEEVREFARLCGITITLEEAKRQIALSDKNGNGSIEFDEIMATLNDRAEGKYH